MKGLAEQINAVFNNCGFELQNTDWAEHLEKQAGVNKEWIDKNEYIKSTLNRLTKGGRGPVLRIADPGKLTLQAQAPNEQLPKWFFELVGIYYSFIICEFVVRTIETKKAMDIIVPNLKKDVLFLEEGMTLNEKKKFRFLKTVAPLKAYEMIEEALKEKLERVVYQIEANGDFGAMSYEIRDILEKNYDRLKPNVRKE